METLIFGLFIVFLVLKLCGVISMSWIWVLSPLWIPVVLIGIYVMCEAYLDTSTYHIKDEEEAN